MLRDFSGKIGDSLMMSIILIDKAKPKTNSTLILKTLFIFMGTFLMQDQALSLLVCLPSSVK